MALSIRKYGWRPDLPDQRDLKYTPSTPEGALVALPPSVNLQNTCPAVYDQGRIGSCTAQAIAGAIECERVKQKLKPLSPSRLFIYYNERVIEKSVMYDAGAMIRTGMKTIAAQGVCSETCWPYNDTPANIYTYRWQPTAKPAIKPPRTCYQNALFTKVSRYLRVDQNLTSMKSCLAEGYPFVFGFSVYESFESDIVAQTGIVPMPSPTEQNLGGHAVLCVGYDDATSRFLVRNSWGNAWGQQGYFTMPYEYLTDNNLADDFWTVRLMTK